MTATEHSQADTTEKVSFGAGCFWQVEMDFREMAGVTDTAVGYEGGDVDNPTYEQVCSGRTGHAEVCQVSFDPAVVSFGELLDKFWEIHDPTQVDRQGPDRGSQYRTVIFFHSEEQRLEAEASEQAQAVKHKQPIATSIEPATGFWMAEDYHQCYLDKRGPRQGLLGALFGS